MPPAAAPAAATVSTPTTEASPYVQKPIDTLALKAAIQQEIGDKFVAYWRILKAYIGAKINKRELDFHVQRIGGTQCAALHNKLLSAIIFNAEENARDVPLDIKKITLKTATKRKREDTKAADPLGGDGPLGISAALAAADEVAAAMTAAAAAGGAKVKPPKKKREKKAAAAAAAAAIAAAAGGGVDAKGDVKPAVPVVKLTKAEKTAITKAATAKAKAAAAAAAAALAATTAEAAPPVVAAKETAPVKRVSKKQKLAAAAAAAAAAAPAPAPAVAVVVAAKGAAKATPTKAPARVHVPKGPPQIVLGGKNSHKTPLATIEETMESCNQCLELPDFLTLKRRMQKCAMDNQLVYVTDDSVALCMKALEQRLKDIIEKCSRVVKPRTLADLQAEKRAPPTTYSVSPRDLTSAFSIAPHLMAEERALNMERSLMLTNLVDV